MKSSLMDNPKNINSKERHLKALKKNITPKSRLEFRPVTIEDIPLIDRYLLTYGSDSCDYTIGGILMWVKYFDYQIAEYAGTLFMRGKSVYGEGFSFSLPVGRLQLPAALAKIRKYCLQENIEMRLMVPEEELDRVKTAIQKEDFRIIPIPDWRDYLYDIELFKGFPGKKMSKKRNHLNGFLRDYPQYQIEEITEDKIHELIEFTKKFGKLHDEDEMARYETEATIEVLEQYNRYPFEGILIRIDGSVAGFTIGETVGITLFVHIEKGLSEYRGVYQMLASTFSKFMSERHPEIALINREDDAGNDNLRKSKLSYNPLGYVEKFILEF